MRMVRSGLSALVRMCETEVAYFSETLRVVCLFCFVVGGSMMEQVRGG